MSQRLLFFIIFSGLVLIPRPGFTQDTGVLPTSTDMLAKGTYAPDFTLNDINGNLIDISGRLGRDPIVLAFWSIYCDSCVDEMLALQKLEDKYHSQGLVILAVNEDSTVPANRVTRFLDRLKKFRGEISYPVLYDPDSKVSSDYKITHLPSLVIIDRDGRIAGYFRGFDAEGERDFLNTIEDTLGREDTTEDTRSVMVQRHEVITVTGEAVLCGFYESGAWRKGFTGSENLQQEIALTRDVARRDAARRSVVSALKMLGVVLHSNPPRLDCLDGSGIHLARDPLDMSDPLSNLIAQIDYSDIFETEDEQDMLIGTTFYSTRTLSVFMDHLAGELESLGYYLEPLRISFTYVNMSSLDRKLFLGALLKQSMFVGHIETPVLTPHSTTQALEVYTSSENFADEITDIDFGDLNVFIEEVTETSLEIEVWR
jgi:peroxiredoxin